MDIIVLSPPDFREGEIDTLVALFHKGLEIFHLRKPGFSLDQTREYLNRIPGKFHRRFVLHHHHRLLESYGLKGIHFTENRRRNDPGQIEKIKTRHPEARLSASFHSFEDIRAYGHHFSYVFLSPIFDSISKEDYKAAFNFEALNLFLESTPVNVMALGGVNKNNIGKIKEMGFSGAAVLGAVWQDNSPVEAYLRIKKAAGAASVS